MQEKHFILKDREIFLFLCTQQEIGKFNFIEN